MASPDFPLYTPDRYPIKDIASTRIGIIRTEWNNAIVDVTEQRCHAQLMSLGVLQHHIYTYSVPGSYELPRGAKMLLGSIHKPDAVICLGCVIQGETKHDDYINHTIARSINQLALVSGTPVVFGVLTTNTLEQAISRADGTKGDKGSESAMVALKMISLKESLAGKHTKIGF